MAGRLIDADALYNGAMKDEYFDFVSHDNHGRESFAYSCAMQRLSEAPTIAAIPVEWLNEKIRDEGERGNFLHAEYIKDLIWEWHQEQGAQAV